MGFGLACFGVNFIFSFGRKEAFTATPKHLYHVFIYSTGLHISGGCQAFSDSGKYSMDFCKYSIKRPACYRNLIEFCLQDRLTLSILCMWQPALIKVSPVHGNGVSKGKSRHGLCWGSERSKLTFLGFSGKWKGL